MQDVNKDFKTYIETLPAEIKQAIYSIDYPKKLQEIVRNNKLMIDQAGKLEAETTLIMAGIEPMNKYINNLSKNVGLSSIQASAVAHDVNELVFKNIREALKKINEEMQEEEKYIEKNTVSPAKEPTKEELLAAIEHPENIKENEESISLSSLKSNGVNPESHENIAKDIEIRTNILPEIAPESILPIISSLTSKPTEGFHNNISPVQNIVESKLNSLVIVPKQTVTIETKMKLPEKPKSSGDPYREAII